MPEPLLSATGLRAAYAGPAGTVHALAGVDLTLRRGERLGVIGRSGSGKSTLARLLCGLPLPGAFVAGELAWPGGTAPVHRARREGLARHVAYLPQQAQAALHPLLRIRSMVRETLAAAGRPRDGAAVSALLAAVELDPAIAGRYPHEISGGQAQRVALACCLAQAPEVLVVDEPTSALDRDTAAAVVALLRRATEKVALLLVSHDLPVVAALCGRVVVLGNGAVVEEGPAALLDRPRSEAARALAAAGLPGPGGAAAC